MYHHLHCNTPRFFSNSDVFVHWNPGQKKTAQISHHPAGTPILMISQWGRSYLNPLARTRNLMKPPVQGPGTNPAVRWGYFLPFEDAFCVETTTFRSQALSQSFTKYCPVHQNFIKYWTCSACHWGRHSNFIKYCRRHERIQFFSLLFSFPSILHSSILYSFLFYFLLFDSFLFYALLFPSILDSAMLFSSILSPLLFFPSYSLLFYAWLFYSLLFSSSLSNYFMCDVVHGKFQVNFKTSFDYWYVI